MIAVATPSASAVVTLITLIACTLLLGLRVWSNVSDFALSRLVSVLLTVAIGLLGITFLVLVVVRFETVV